MYGIVGSQTLLFEQVASHCPDGVAILRTPVDHYRKIWAALTMFTHLDNQPVRYTVTKATPFAFALTDHHFDT